MTKSEHTEDDGTNVLTELDLFEVSIVAHPANDRTRILSMKAADESVRLEAREQMLEVLTASEPVPTTAELKAMTKTLGVEELARKARPIQIATFEC